jgi:tight adherence protein B
MLDRQYLLLMLICLGMLSICTIILGIVRAMRRRHVSYLQRLQDLEEQRQQIRSAILEQSDSKKNGAIASVLERATHGTPMAHHLGEKLRLGDVPLTVGEVLVIQALIAALGILVGLWMNNLWLAGVAVITAYFVPQRWLNSRITRRIRTFESQLPDMIQMLGNAMRAGISIQNAIQRIAPELPAPMSVELGRVAKELSFHVSLQDALLHFQQNMPSDDLVIFTTALNVQLESGGSNITTTLERISEKIRERIKLNAEIKSLTAQQQYSGYVIAMLPVGLVTLLLVINPNYILQVFRTTGWCGWVMFGTALVFLVTGFLTIRSITQVRV